MSNPTSKKIKNLDKTSLQQLSGVGVKLAEKLARLGLLHVQDLLFHLPLRFQDRTRVHPFAQALPGIEIQVEGTVTHSQIHMGKRRSLAVTLRDETSLLVIRFYHFTAAQKASFSQGSKVRCFGEVRRGVTGFEMYHPEYKILSNTTTSTLSSEGLTPVYPSTEGLNPNRLRQIMMQALEWLQREPEILVDYLPPETYQQQTHLPKLSEAIFELHNPGLPHNVDSWLGDFEQGSLVARQRLAFEELLAHHLALTRVREQIRSHPAPKLTASGKLATALLQNLPFKLTSAQHRVVNEIKHDMSSEQAMLRLVQGDVGSGKTIVAALAALQAVEAGYQVALMAPTEILAEQHIHNFTHWFTPIGCQVNWLLGKQSAAQRREHLHAIATGEAKVIIGTHALIQDSVEFDRLALVIIDEQHRFGVQQRLSLSRKSFNSQPPHQLIMTATPIPRTMAMSAYADLDCSIIDELPPGRVPVNTVVMSNQRRGEVIQRIAAACQQNRQAYWVCTLIEESESIQSEAAEVTLQQLQQQLPELHIGLVHGRLKAQEKQAVMNAFKSGAIQLLVATTVIEVGVDVPNASLMIIENPERLGLAQLHQLRGRVGRGQTESHCVLMYNAPLSETSRTRLHVMRETSDGFVIAEKDLEIRGPGEVLGTRQTGLLNFKIADLQKDMHLYPHIQQTAQQLHCNYPDLIESIIERWIDQAQEYLQV